MHAPSHRAKFGSNNIFEQNLSNLTGNNSNSKFEGVLKTIFFQRMRFLNGSYGRWSEQSCPLKQTVMIVGANDNGHNRSLPIYGHAVQHKDHIILYSKIPFLSPLYFIPFLKKVYLLCNTTC